MRGLRGKTTIIAVTAIAGMAPATADAATAGRLGGTISVNGATAYLDIFQSGPEARLIDREGGTISAVSGCSGTSPDVFCGPVATLTRVNADLSEGFDSIQNTLDVPFFAFGRGGNDYFAVDIASGSTIAMGSGNDRFAASINPCCKESRFSGADNVHGNGGKDRIEGGFGRDVLFGDAGKDKLTGGQGRDRLVGGAGRDKRKAQDGKRDKVAGGPGRDKAFVDSKDDVSGVEVVIGG